MSDAAQIPPRATRRGRPAHRGVKWWQRSEVLEHRLRSVVADREKDDELAVETNADVVRQVVGLGRVYLDGSLTTTQEAQLRRYARSKPASEITRLLYRWRHDLTDREVRGLQGARRTIIDVLWA